jgi:hypothetical protein
MRGSAQRGIAEVEDTRRLYAVLFAFNARPRASPEPQVRGQSLASDPSARGLKCLHCTPPPQQGGGTRL